MDRRRFTAPSSPARCRRGSRAELGVDIEPDLPMDTPPLTQSSSDTSRCWFWLSRGKRRAKTLTSHFTWSRGGSWRWLRPQDGENRGLRGGMLRKTRDVVFLMRRPQNLEPRRPATRDFNLRHVSAV